MIINHKKFTDAIRRAGLSEEQVAAAIDRPGLNATSAVRNWRRGDFRPRPKPDDLRRLASALGVAPQDIVKYDGSYKWARMSPTKVKLVTDLIRGKDVNTALNLLAFSKKRAAVAVKKALQTAIASAENNEVDVATLQVTESYVGSGPTLKRFQPKDRGRAHQILKRTSHIVVAVEAA